MKRSSLIGMFLRRETGLLIVLGLFSPGCPSATPASSPESVLNEYADAVQSGALDRAYSLMSLPYRKRYDKKDFIRMLQENPAEVKSLAQQLKVKAQQVEMEAQLEFGENETLKLVVENGAWKVATDPLDFYSQRTPAEALRSFVRALERRRYNIVLRFVPSKWADTMTVEKLRREWEGEKKDEVATLIKNLKANFNAPIHQSGNTATMPYGEKLEVRFLLEDGVWKVEDPD
jgi:hypothetical protein